jgi:hypothetical protein
MGKENYQGAIAVIGQFCQGRIILFTGIDRVKLAGILQDDMHRLNIHVYQIGFHGTIPQAFAHNLPESLRLNIDPINFKIQKVEVLNHGSHVIHLGCVGKRRAMMFEAIDIGDKTTD